jgi:glutathione S-transferase
MSLQLVIGNKNYSSWSFRPWLAMKVAGIAFDETVIPLHTADFETRLKELGGSGSVPVLIDGDVRIWESLAILEYLAEKFPTASAIASEMHAGFAALRRDLPMNVARPVKFRALDQDAAKDVARIDAIWNECRNKYGAGGAFLFGSFGAADAMFAPIVWRFHTYAVEVSSTASGYMHAMKSLPAWKEWRDAARGETWVLPADEVDWPQVLRE